MSLIWRGQLQLMHPLLEHSQNCSMKMTDTRKCLDTIGWQRILRILEIVKQPKCRLQLKRWRIISKTRVQERASKKCAFRCNGSLPPIFNGGNLQDDRCSGKIQPINDSKVPGLIPGHDRQIFYFFATLLILKYHLTDMKVIICDGH